MNSMSSAFKPDASGISPKQMDYIPYLTLSDGREIPMIGYGLGTANHSSGDKKFDQKIVDDTVTAIKAGYNHLDGAESYANEEELGAAIKAAKVPRENLFVTTKVTCAPDRPIEEAFAASLKKLQLDYVDLYLIHSPFWAGGDAKLLQKKWAEMEAIKASGRARSIGVSNYLKEHLEAVLETAKDPPVLNQIEYHAYLQHADLMAYQREHGIAAAAYGPLTTVTKAKGGPIDALQDKLARKYGVNPGEVALRWCIDTGVVAITTSSNEQRLRSFMTKLPSFKLTPKEAEEMSELGKQKHYRGFWQKHFDDDDRR
ncbi:uncharacterized protein E0L32_006394 [Thyridium curvatum]|uniref:NADP-dependent oxidoreductase domain-containing protein n=1 Tax=Thyridium curvatum TaxID=1093900 RepID=A0A507B386_9PEZI|nr:uncharacterized protein E0L32_006394 [Thyridium curvatum]TPX13194.1 hypothetical protein E0L32_006394 [Thyridium curvatum]